LLETCRQLGREFIYHFLPVRLLGRLNVKSSPVTEVLIYS